MKIIFLLKKIFVKIIPTKQKRIVFTSFNGHYSDSPKYICAEVHKINPKLELVWLVNEKYKSIVPNYAKAVTYNSIRGLYYYASASILVDNVYGGKESNLISNTFISKMKFNLLNFLNYKKKQFVYTTWHGMPIKKMGRDQLNSKSVIDFACPNTTMIVNEKHTYDIMNHINFEKINMKLLGSPRNDLLYLNDKEYIAKIKKKLELPLDKKIIMFVPTFRSDNGILQKNVEKSGLNQLNEINFNELFEALKNKFGGEWIFVCRFHYHVEKMVDWNNLKNIYGDKILNGNEHDDIMEYLLCTDVLITDISSALCDFALTEKPIFTIFPDYENYKNEERGLYIPIEKLPFNINMNFYELFDDIMKFDLNSYIQKVRNFKQEYGYVSNKNSSRTIAEYILNERNLV